MAEKKIFDLDPEVTPVATDEMEIQKTLDGDSFKATIGNILNKVLGVLGIDKFKLNVNAGEIVAQGEMAYNLDEDTFDFGIGGATWQGFLEWGYNVRNTTGTLIPDGTPVMKAGTIGLSGRILIEPWDGSDPANSVFYMGITTGDIANNGDGKTTAFGKVRDIDTSAWSEDDILYLSPTTGFVTEPPTRPNVLMPTALVINSHASAGTIHVRALPIDFNSFGDVSAAANLGDNLLVRGDGSGKGVQNSAVVISDEDEISGGNSLVVEKPDNYTLAAGDSGKSFPQTGAAKAFSLPADTSSFKLGWFVTLYAPTGGVVTVDQLATADATVRSVGDFTDISAKGAGVLELIDDTPASFVFSLSGNLE